MAQRVLHVLGDAGPRGAAQTAILSSLASVLDAERYELFAWYLNGGEQAHPAPIAGVRSALVPFAGGRDPIGALRFAKRLAVLRPQIVHLHIGGRSRTRILRALTSARLVAHLHTAASEDGRALRLQSFAESADVVIATSRAVADLAGVPATVVHPGVQIEKPLPRRTRSTTQTIGVVARLEPVKGIDTLLHAVAVLKQRHPGLHVQIAGSGSAHPSLVALCDRLSLEDTVEFLGWRDDLAQLHANWDVFALPSRHEGFGLAALEAMAAGLPVVASRTGGVPELVEHGVSGLLVDPGDVAALAAALERLLADPELRARMGAAARKRAKEHFSVAKMGSAIEAVYDALLAGDRPG